MSYHSLCSSEEDVARHRNFTERVAPPSCGRPKINAESFRFQSWVVGNPKLDGPRSGSRSSGISVDQFAIRIDPVFPSLVVSVCIPQMIASGVAELPWDTSSAAPLI